MKTTCDGCQENADLEFAVQVGANWTRHVTDWGRF